MAFSTNEFYTGGAYLKNNPTWDSEDAKLKSSIINKIINNNNIKECFDKLFKYKIDKVNEITETNKQQLLSYNSDIKKTLIKFFKVKNITANTTPKLVYVPYSNNEDYESVRLRIIKMHEEVK